MFVNSKRFGRLAVSEKDIIYFENGLIGLESLTKFFFVPFADNPFFIWLHSLEEKEKAFLLVDPFIFFPDYEVQLSDEQRKSLQIEDPADLRVFSTVSIPEKACLEDITTNLIGPLVVNSRSRLGLQVVLEATSYSTRQLLFSHKDSFGYDKKGGSHACPHP